MRACSAESDSACRLSLPPLCQADHERYKSEAASKFNAANEEVERLRAEVATKEGEASLADAEVLCVVQWRQDAGGSASKAQQCWCSASNSLPLQAFQISSSSLPSPPPQVREARLAEREYATECERLEGEYGGQVAALKVRPDKQPVWEVPYEELGESPWMQGWLG